MGDRRALRVTIFYTAPTAIRACMKWGARVPGAARPLARCGCSGSVGEPINPKAWLWYHEVIGGERCPIVDTWWQTETGHIMITPLPGITETKPGSATQPFPGIDGGGRRQGRRERRGGRPGLLIAAPAVAGDVAHALQGGGALRRDLLVEVRARTSTWSATPRASDEDGYFWIVGRTDDVINVSGHRMSTMEIESAIVSHDRVAEAAVIGQPDEDTGQAIVAFVTLEGERGEGGDELDAELREHVAEKIGKLARPKRIIWADDLPKTRSGKIMRRLLRDIAEGRELGDVTTLRDPGVMSDLAARGGRRRRVLRRLDLLHEGSEKGERIVVETSYDRGESPNG